MEKKINIHEFARRYHEIYNYLYDNQPDYSDAVDAFDKFLPSHKEFIGEFCKYINDYISSDREAAAFMYALEEMSNQ